MATNAIQCGQVKLSEFADIILAIAFKKCCAEQTALVLFRNHNIPHVGRHDNNRPI